MLKLCIGCARGKHIRGQGSDSVSRRGLTQFRVLANLCLTPFILAAFLFSSPVSAQGPTVPPEAEGLLEALPADHLIDVLKKDSLPSGGPGSADASKFSGMVRIGGFSERYRGILEVGNSVVQDLENIRRTISNNAIVINAPQYRGDQYFPGIVWRTGTDNPTKPKLGIWGQLTNAGSRMYFGTSNNYDIGITNTALTIDSSGRVGVGTTSPGADFELYRPTSAELRVSAVDGVNTRIAKLSLRGSGNGGAITGGAIIDFTDSDSTPGTPGALTFQKKGSTYLTILNGGNVGIGTIEPATLLDVNGSAMYSGVATIRNAVNTGDVNHGILSLINTLKGATGNDARVMFTLKRTGLSTGNDAMASMGAVKEAADYAAALQFNTRSTDSVFTEKMRITSNGNVGIGTTNPNAPLHVNGGIYLNDWSGRNMSRWGIYTWNHQLQFSLRNVNDTSSQAGSPLLVLSKEGKVGIGTANPGGFLHVNGGTASAINGPGLPIILSAQQGNSTAAGGTLSLLAGDGGYSGKTTSSIGGHVYITAGRGGYSGSAQGGTINLTAGQGGYEGTTATSAGGSVNVTAGRGGYSGSAKGGDITLTAGNSSYERGGNGGNIILIPGIFTGKGGTAGSNGNVGIGTTSPTQAKLVISNGGLAKSSGWGGNDLVFGNGNGSSAFYHEANNVYWYTSSGQAISLRPQGSEAMRIATNGNVGIGTPDPSLGGKVNGRFTINSTTDSTQLALGVNGNPRFALNTNPDSSWTMYDYASGGWTPGITQRSGNVGIGMTNPEGKLQVNGALYLHDANGDKGAKWGIYGWDDALHFSKRDADWNYTNTDMYMKTDGLYVGSIGMGWGAVGTYRLAIKVDNTSGPNSAGIYTEGRRGEALKAIKYGQDYDVIYAEAVDSPNSRAITAINGMYGRNGASNVPTIYAWNRAWDTATGQWAGKWGKAAEFWGTVCINGDCRYGWNTASGGGGGSSQWTSVPTGISYTGGNVGIGTASPGAKLHVQDIYPAIFGHDGMLKIKSLTTTYGSETVALQTTIDGRSDDYNIADYGGASRHLLSLQPYGGKVGIGTTDPSSPLTVKGTAERGTIRVYPNTKGEETSIRFSKDNSNLEYWVVGANTFGVGENNFAIAHHYNYNSTIVPIYSDFIAITITGRGNVGIGTTRPCPGCRLDVQDGDINVGYSGDNNFAGLSKKTKLAYETDRIGLDVAELFESEEEVTVGDIVAVAQSNRKLKKSSSQYQGTIVGVVSGAPALLFEGSELKLGSKPERFSSGTKPPVALAGRIPVKVSLENGLIAPGDYLTSSSKHGVAMKATEPGMTIGVALEEYTGKGDGTILIFLNLGEKNAESLRQQLKVLEDRLRNLERRFRW